MGSIPGLGRSSGKGNGYPLQYSCLENLMDRGAWWATVHGVAKSQTSAQSLSKGLLLLFSRYVMSYSLRFQELKHTRLSCPSPSPGVCSNSCSLSQMPSNHLILSQGDNDQHMLRKEVTDIHTRKSPHSKYIKPTQATQRHPHI